MLIHNPYLNEGTRISARGDKQTEELAIRWAGMGLSRIEDIHNGTTFMTTHEFQQRWPSLTNDSWAYEELINSIPNEWIATLTNDTCIHTHTQEIWYHLKGKFWRTWSTPNEVDLPSKRICQQYKKDDKLALLEPAKPANSLHEQPPPHTATEYSVEQNTSQTEAAPTWSEGDTKSMRKASEKRYTHILISINCRTCHEPLHDLAIEPAGLLQRQPVTLHALTPKHARYMLITQAPVIPRAWDINEPSDHFAHL